MAEVAITLIILPNTRLSEMDEGHSVKHITYIKYYTYYIIFIPFKFVRRREFIYRPTPITEAALSPPLCSRHRWRTYI